MSKTLRASLILGMTLGFSLAASARRYSKNERQPRPQITIRVYDYAGLNARLLHHAVDYAGNVFERAGVRLGSVVCGVENTIADPAVCGQAPNPANFQMRIVSGPAAAIAGTDDLTFGYASGPVITIYYSRVKELAGFQTLVPTKSWDA